MAEDDLLNSHWARCLTDDEVLHALESLDTDPVRVPARHARLRDLLDEVSRRRLVRVAPVLLGLFAQWDNPTGKMQLAAHLTSLGEFAAVPHAKQSFDRSNPIELRHYSTWVLGNTWTIQEMREIAADPEETASIRKGAASCLAQRLRLEAQFTEEFGTTPAQASENVLKGILGVQDTMVLEVALAELYRRNQKSK
jgi:hypothetical protein